MGIDAVGIGSLNYDYIFKVDTLAMGDQQVVIKDKMFSPGGSSANSIYWLAKLGLQTGFLSAVGTDLEGQKILAQMAENGTETSHIGVLSNKDTSKVFVFVDNSGERAMYSLPGASLLFRANEKNITWLKQSSYSIISAIPGDEQLINIQEIVKDIYQDTRVVFIPGALYVKLGFPRLEEIITRSFLLILNRREILELTSYEYMDGVQWLLDHGVRYIAVTLGEQGSLIASKESWHIVPTPKLAKSQIIDSTGAGDAFAAGLIYGLLSNRPIQDAAILGNLLARSSIQATGARACEIDGVKLEKEFKEYQEFL